jgi:hypothetical protein
MLGQRNRRMNLQRLLLGKRSLRKTPSKCTVSVAPRADRIIQGSDTQAKMDRMIRTPYGICIKVVTRVEKPKPVAVSSRQAEDPWIYKDL